ncbi:hypothetical protein D3C80_1200370 [compost metagenome]
MLATAAVLGAEPCITFTAYEPGRFDQKEMNFGALAVGPCMEQLALALQFGQLRRAQVRGVANPDVHIALFGLRQGAQATHQEQPVNGPAQLIAAGLVSEGASQALGLDQGLRVRLIVADASGRGTRDVAGQQGMIDVKKHG